MVLTKLKSASSIIKVAVSSSSSSPPVEGSLSPSALSSSTVASVVGSLSGSSRSLAVI